MDYNAILSKVCLCRDVTTFTNNIITRLGAEEVLTESGLPYVILRSADTVGSRDTTHRWWQYQVRNHGNYRVTMETIVTMVTTW